MILFLPCGMCILWLTQSTPLSMIQLTQSTSPSVSTVSWKNPCWISNVKSNSSNLNIYSEIMVGNRIHILVYIPFEKYWNTLTPINIFCVLIRQFANWDIFDILSHQYIWFYSSLQVFYSLNGLSYASNLFGFQFNNLIITNFG